ncbi:Rhomboid family protein [compost metagenome]
MVGASAGVFSVLAYYAVLFPKSRFQVTSFYRTVRMDSVATRLSFPIGYYLVAVLALEIFNVYMMSSPGIGHLAHLGGAAVGLLMAVSRKTSY